jgi:DNA-directed RNA polymerase subunit alpha
MRQKPIFEVKKEQADGVYGRFVIEPLEQGYGHTLGVSLRRVLLSSLPGAAITQVKISGLKHQFSPIKGVKEDGVDLILNLKKVRLFYDGDKPVTLKLEAQEVGEVKAGSIKTPPDVKIANPDLVIATLTDEKAKLEIEMQVETGVGYLPSEERKVATIGVIPIDADFSPVQRVAYKVEETRVGRLTNYDRLILEIWTDGTIDPESALKKAAEILVLYFNHIVSPSVAKPQDQEFKQGNSDNLQLENISVEELNLPTRVINALEKGGYETVADVIKAGRQGLVKVRNLGEKSVKIIEAALAEKNISLEG